MPPQTGVFPEVFSKCAMREEPQVSGPCVVPLITWHITSFSWVHTGKASGWTGNWLQVQLKLVEKKSSLDLHELWLASRLMMFTPPYCSLWHLSHVKPGQGKCQVMQCKQPPRRRRAGPAIPSSAVAERRVYEVLLLRVAGFGVPEKGDSRTWAATNTLSLTSALLVSLFSISSALSQSPPSSSSPQSRDSAAAGSKNLSAGVPAPRNYRRWFAKWWWPAQCYLPDTPHLPVTNRWVNSNKSCGFLCFPLFAFPSRLSSAAQHRSPLSPPPSPPSSPSQEAKEEQHPFPRLSAGRASWGLTHTVQLATRICVCARTCKCARVWKHGFHIKVRILLQKGWRAQDKIRNLAGNGSKLPVFSSFHFFIPVSTPALCVQRCIYSRREQSSAAHRH